MMLIFDYKNNDMAEGFHNKMEILSERAYGFRNFENYRLRVTGREHTLLTKLTKE
jgi:transposase